MDSQCWPAECRLAAVIRCDLRTSDRQEVVR